MVLLCTWWPTWARTRAFDFARRGHFPALGSREKGSQECLLFFPGHRLTATTPFASGLDRHHCQAIVAGNHSVYHRHGGAGVFGNLCCFAWLDQRILDNEPALSAPRTWVPFQSRFEFFCPEMRSRSCDPGHVVLLSTCVTNWFPHSLIFLTSIATWYKEGSVR
jgi:hypothetical protein